MVGIAGDAWRRPLARDHAAPESTLALSKADQPCCGRVRPLAWCSRPRDSAASLAGALSVLEQQPLDTRVAVPAGCIDRSRSAALAEVRVRAALECQLHELVASPLV